MHLSIEIPTPPPPRAKAGECGGFLWHLKARFARGGLGISQHLHLHIHQGRGVRWGFDSCLVSSRQFLHMVTGVARGSLDFVQLFGSTSGFER